MVGRKKKPKIWVKVSHEEDKISQLPEHLISEILYHLSTKDAVRTSLLSTKWRYLWQSVPGLDLVSYKFSSFDAFVSFVESYFGFHRESWIRKLRLRFDYSQGMRDISSWIDAVSTRRIQHLDVNYRGYDKTPLSIYTCETLVHLRLCGADLPNAEFVSLPCLKIMHLEDIICSEGTTLEKLISGSPVLEDLTIIRSSYTYYDRKAIQVRSHTLKRIDINEGIHVVIDAPLLQCLRTDMYSIKNFRIITLGFPSKLDIDMQLMHLYLRPNESVIRDILTDISRVRDLVISRNTWKEIFLYSQSRPVLQFRNLSRLNVRFDIFDLEMLPTLLESCTKLESLVLELFKDQSMRRHEEKREMNVMFSAVPRCLVSSLKFVELKRSIPRYEGEIELIRYLLKNSRMLQKLSLNVYYKKKAKRDFLIELDAMPKCSSACEVLVL
ncbi:F-box/FBD/LRR-repeat protein At1g51370-like [Arabidopsis lyrata subsp. lyrata]|uniref:F-box/FBD/LRR-repeat protein At1g51370-like n=1 Tax=Arabidopsis lyrata subsp. lyrata TaxID=81972 RepID=UPI000A29D12A|nr:F-box/FBD/LRR-repeat protein At1g51370-like [Arabidopsis lyrata subsp. lyrata]|eukprot:XP_020884976.1 F-box/FBD/LRR-repeat protein At1g51370-like [Arabidopsis lyrata subsp. lyrata]